MTINSEVRYAAHPQDVKHYDTAQLRQNYLIEKVFSADEINIVYTMHDRMIAGGAMPVKEVLELKPIDILRSEYFLPKSQPLSSLPDVAYKQPPAGYPHSRR